MNKVYLSGEIYDEPMLINHKDALEHLVFSLMVKHKSKAGMRREVFRISAWNQCAAYAYANLKRGMRVAVEGYLTQRPVTVGDKQFVAVEVAVSELLLPATAAVEQSP